MTAHATRWALGIGAALLACTRAAPSEQASPASSAAPVAPSRAPPPPELDARAVTTLDANLAARSPSRALADRVDGPHELPLSGERAVFYALPRGGERPWRVVGHLHGICYPPSYSCGRWIGAASDLGVLVCPTGNARCGDSGVGPPSWEAPTWEELVTIMDGDLERSIAKVEAKHRGSIRRDGGVLTGFSRGAYAAPVIARLHPGRWPYLVLIEANVPLAAASLRKAGVRAVALVAGETGTELAGERRTAAALEEAGFPVRLFVMPRVAHLYSDDMDQIMREALAFVTSHEG